MKNFDNFELPDALLSSLKLMQFETPTPIQAETIPHALIGKDVFGTAQTGTGKTLAYLIPLIAHLINSPDSSALILTPTRELALQVLNVLKQLVTNKGNIQPTLLIGGDSMFKQLNQLSRKPRLFVGTPGRINDHLSRGSLKLNKVDFVVFDETDRMLDMGFSIQLERIAKYLPEKRQILMFSATITPEIVKISRSYMQDEIRLSVGSTTAPIAKIKQEILNVKETEKYDELLNQLEINKGSFIVFMKTKFATERLAKRLREDDQEADAINGDLRQRDRERVIQNFRDGKHRILVATDVVARGLDVRHVECIVNYDMPQCPEDYIHRIGRTGRAGAEGKAISFISSQDVTKWRVIQKMMNPGEKFQDNSRAESSPRGGKRPSRNTGDRPFAGARSRSRDSGSEDRPRTRGAASGGFSSGARPRSSSSDYAGKTEGRSFSGARPRSGSSDYAGKPEGRSFSGARPRSGSSDYAGKTASRSFAGARPRGKDSGFEGRSGTRSTDMSSDRFNRSTSARPGQRAPYKSAGGAVKAGGRVFATKSGVSERTTRPGRFNRASSSRD